MLAALVGLGIGIAAVVLRRLGAHEDVGIAVGIDPAAPADLESLELAGLRLLERGRKLDQADLHVDARFRRHRLDHLRHGFVFGALGHHEIDGDGEGGAGFLQQRLGFCDIALRNRKVLLIVGMLRADPLIARNELAVEHDLGERLAVDRQAERLAHLFRLAERALVLVVADIDGDAEITDLERGRQL